MSRRLSWTPDRFRISRAGFDAENPPNQFALAFDSAWTSIIRIHAAGVVTHTVSLYNVDFVPFPALPYIPVVRVCRASGSTVFAKEVVRRDIVISPTARFPAATTAWDLRVWSSGFKCIPSSGEVGQAANPFNDRTFTFVYLVLATPWR